MRRLMAVSEQWRNAPVWTPETIAKATEDWFRYLAPDENPSQDLQ